MVGDIVEYKGTKYAKTFNPTGNCNVCAFHKEEFDWCFDVDIEIVGTCVEEKIVFVKFDDLGLSENEKKTKKKKPLHLA